MEYGGGLFNIEANSPFLSGKASELVKPDWQLFRSGRDALRAFAGLAKNRADSVLLPALCCDSMYIPFEQNGYKIRFYRLKPDMTADTVDVLSKLSSRCALLYMPYLGTTPFESDFLELLRKKGVLLLEDRTQDIIVPRQAGGFTPDATAASLRKWAALPGGGMLSTALGISDRITDDTYSDMCMDAMRSKEAYLRGGVHDAALKSYYLNEFHAAEELLDESSAPVAMSADCVERLYSIDFEKLYRTRKANIICLREKLKPLLDSGKLALMNSTPENSTLYLPVLLDDRDAVLRKLIDRNIYCAVLWRIPPKASGVCVNSEDASARMIALPCDQRHTPEDMTFIAASLIEIMEK